MLWRIFKLNIEQCNLHNLCNSHKKIFILDILVVFLTQTMRNLSLLEVITTLEKLCPSTEKVAGTEISPVLIWEDTAMPVPDI